MGKTPTHPVAERRTAATLRKRPGPRLLLRNRIDGLGSRGVGYKTLVLKRPRAVRVASVVEEELLAGSFQSTQSRLLLYPLQDLEALGIRPTAGVVAAGHWEARVRALGLKRSLDAVRNERKPIRVLAVRVTSAEIAHGSLIIHKHSHNLV